MKQDLVRQLLLYIVDQLQHMNAQISTIRLVKLLYLIDLEHYIRHKNTLTEINWVYYHFGPYFFELNNTLHSSGIDLDAKEVITSSGKGYTYRVFEDQYISKFVDFATEQHINRIIKRWALEDTALLLEYVYNSLPIKLGKRGDPIDFSLAVEKETNTEKPKVQVSNSTAFGLMLASERVLAKEWDTPEEDEAWEYLSKKAK